jgi:hypothetical protein
MTISEIVTCPTTRHCGKLSFVAAAAWLRGLQPRDLQPARQYIQQHTWTPSKN